MHYITTICAGLNLMAYIWVNVAAADVKMSVYAGNTTVLKCENSSPGDEVMMVTWRVHLLNGTQCTVAHAENHQNHNSCDKRMEIPPNNSMTLRIQNSKITDEGNYTCEVVKPLGTFISKTVILEILNVKMSVYAGNTTVLECENSSPGDEVMMLTWRVHLLKGTQCTLAHAENHSNHNSCDERMEIPPNNNMTLRIQNSKITDEGNYACEVVKPLGTFISKTVILEILIQPCVILKINKNGVAECKAFGGNPIANITWNPESEGLITTDKIKEQDKTSTVISTYRPKNVNVTEITCVVSHPTFAYPQNRSIELTTADDNILWIVLLIIIVIIIIAVLITGSILYWKSRNLRSYYRTGVTGTRAIHTEDNIEQNKEEVEPYASYTQKVNAIYSTAPLNSEAAL